MRKKKAKELTSEHLALYSMIPTGHKNAVSRSMLQIMTGLDDRVIRKFCEELTCNEKVVCNLQDGKGYYRPASEEDYVAALKLTKSRANALNRKAYGIESAYKKFLLDGDVLVGEH